MLVLHEELRGRVLRGRVAVRTYVLWLKTPKMVAKQTSLSHVAMTVRAMAGLVNSSSHRPFARSPTRGNNNAPDQMVAWSNDDAFGMRSYQCPPLPPPRPPAFAKRMLSRFMYLVDLALMTQTNVTHPNRKMRHIRRNPGKSLPNTPPRVSTGKVRGNAVALPSDFVLPIFCVSCVLRLWWGVVAAVCGATETTALSSSFFCSPSL